MAIAGEEPDVVIACVGGGSNFGGLAFPFLRRVIRDGAKTRFIAAEPAACPTLTRGVYAYDFGDTVGLTPLMPMYTLGHDFVPPPCTREACVITATRRSCAVWSKPAWSSLARFARTRRSTRPCGLHARRESSRRRSQHTQSAL